MIKQILGICFILIVSIGFNVIQYSSNNKLKDTILTYEDELGISEGFDNEDNGIGQNTNLDVDAINNTNNPKYLLKEVPTIYFHSYIDGVYEEWFSAAGPLAYINPFGVNATNKDAIKILEGGNEHFTKISLEGYVPTWYLTQGEDDLYINFHYIEEDKYILNETNAYYGADENAGVLKALTKGTAIKVIGEYKDWYYIDLLNAYSGMHPEGWVKKDSVGLLSASDLENAIGIEVRIEKGIVGTCNAMEGSKPYILGDTMVGEISEETDTHYYVKFPGMLTVCVEKEDVQFMGQ